MYKVSLSQTTHYLNFLFLLNPSLVAGWGAINQELHASLSVPSGHPISVNVEILDGNTPGIYCSTNGNFVEASRDTAFCAGKEEGGSGPCDGDKGGPMICIENGEPVLVGVVGGPTDLKCAVKVKFMQ